MVKVSVVLVIKVFLSPDIKYHLSEWGSPEKHFLKNCCHLNNMNNNISYMGVWCQYIDPVYVDMSLSNTARFCISTVGISAYI